MHLRRELTICPLLSLLLIEIVSIDRIARGGCNPAAVLFYGYGRLGLTPFAEFGVDKREGDFAFAQVRTGGQLGNRNGDRSVAFAAHREMVAQSRLLAVTVHSQFAVMATVCVVAVSSVKSSAVGSAVNFGVSDLSSSSEHPVNAVAATRKMHRRPT